MQSLHTLTPHLVVRGAEEATRWYANAFGMVEHGHRLFAPGGKFMHIELRVGDCELQIAVNDHGIGTLFFRAKGTPAFGVERHAGQRPIRRSWSGLHSLIGCG